MKNCMKKIVALLLVVSICTGLIPIEGAGIQWARAEALARIDEQTETAGEWLRQTEESFARVAEEAAEKLAQQQTATEGEWTYVPLPEYGYAVIAAHRDQGAGRVDIPPVLGGLDVVALLPGVFANHASLLSVTMAHNVYYAAPDALPRGVAVRGYHGSYAARWAGEHRCAFENLSELDFVSGVVDCSDMDAANFIRHSETSVTLRALEAKRLREGSVFFLADPQNLYAISFYQVVSVGPEEGGLVTFTCETPDISHVLNSFEMENAVMVPDWDTVTLAEGVTLNEDSTLPQGAQSRAAESKTFGLDVSPQVKLGDKGKFTMKVGYHLTSTASAKYKNLELDSYEITTKEEYAIAYEFKYTIDPLERETEEGATSPEDYLQLCLMRAANAATPSAHKLKADKDLCKVMLFSLYGVVNFTLDVGVSVSFTGKVTMTYSSSVVTTHKYANGKMTSKSTPGEKSITLEAEAEIKAGLTISIKVLIFALEVSKLELFVGVKVKASYKIGYKEEIDRLGNMEPSMIIQSVEAQELSLAALNMLSCVQLDVNLLIELTATVGNDWVTILSHTWTLGDVPIASLHVHMSRLKYAMDGLWVKLVPMEPKDFLHKAINCTLMDQVTLMVPEISEKTPMGTLTLHGQKTLKEMPKLELPEHGVRVEEWYRDKKMNVPLDSLEVESGDILYGEAEDVDVITIVNYKGDVMLKSDATDALYCVGEDEQLDFSGLDLAQQEHVVGWVRVKSAEDLTFQGEVLEGVCPKVQGGSGDATWLAICDNDLTITFRDAKGGLLKELETGHFVNITEADLPEVKPEFDLDYARVVYGWRSSQEADSSVKYEFPCRMGAEVGDTLVLYLHAESIERIFETTEDQTSIDGGAQIPSGLNTYSGKDFYEYNLRDSRVIISGFKEEQSYVDESGETHEWTAVPEILVIPSAIDGVPVTAIGDSAFANLETLVSVKVPASVTSIGWGAFANCPELRKVDISACSGLKALPDNFVYGAAKLGGIAIPGSVTSIGSSAFEGCKALTAADINASIGDDAFAGCEKLSTVTLRNRVSSIGEGAFRNCTALTSLTIPCSAKTVGEEFINGCTSLENLIFDGAPTKITEGMLRIGQGSRLQSLELKLGVMELDYSIFRNGGEGHYNLTSLSLPQAMRNASADVMKMTSVEKLTVHDLGVLGDSFARECTTLRELSFSQGVIKRNSFAGCTNLEKLSIGDGVYAIGEGAFRNCTSLTGVTIGKNVLTIGREAFRGCTALETLVMGDEIETVGAYAFADCGALTSVDLGNSLKNLGDYIFYNCGQLEAVYIPSTVEAFGYGVLHNCQSVKHLTVGGPGLPELDAAKLLGRMNNSSLETLVVGEGVKRISDKAFCNPVSNYYVGHPNLRSVVLPSTLESIGEKAFALCSSLETVTLPEGLTSIGAQAFEGCTKLDLICSDKMQLVSIGNYAFEDCTSLTNINLGDSLLTVGMYAFEGCTGLTEMRFPPSVSQMGYGVLYNCKNLRHLALGGPAMPTFDIRTFIGRIEDSQLETVEIGEGVTAIPEGAFCNPASNYYVGHPNLRSVVLPSTVTSIGDKAFALCSGLETLTLPEGLTSIGALAFEGCAKLDLICNDRMQLESIGNYAFKNCASLTNINLGDSLHTVGMYAFTGCTSLEELRFPPSLAKYDYGVVYNCSGLKKLTLGGPLTPEMDIQRFIGRIDNGLLETVVIAEGVEKINDGAFRNPVSNFYVGHAKLRTVVLPSTVKSIGEEAFAACVSLTDLELPAGLKTIGGWAFSGCSALKLICSDRMQLESIGAYAFENCTSLTGINLGSRLKNVERYAFMGCGALKELHFPPTVESFSYGVIYKCGGLKHLTIGGPAQKEFNGRDLIGYIENASLETLTIGEGVEVLCDRAFSNFTSWNHGFKKLRQVSLPSTLKTIGEEAFAECSALEVLHLPVGVESIASNAFEGCTALKTLQTSGQSDAVSGFAQNNGYGYQAETVSHTLTLMMGEEAHYTQETRIGAPLAEVLAAHIPAGAAGMVFDGWRLDAAGEIRFAGGSMPGCDLVLHAAFVPGHTLRYVAAGEGKTLYTAEFTVGEGHELPWPQEPSVSGWRFEGWFTDAALTRKHVSGSRMGKTDVTVYGKMVPHYAGAVYAPVEGGWMLTHFALTDEKNTEVWLPGSVNGRPVVAIAAGAFAEAQGITRLHLPDSLVTIEDGALAELPALAWITTGPGCQGYTAAEGVLYTADMGTLVCFPPRKPATVLAVPETVHTIGPRACAGHAWLLRAELGDHVKTLGREAFADCQQMTSFAAYGLESIGQDALPLSLNLTVYGPVKEGVLREYLLISDGPNPTFQSPYNLYRINLNIDGDFVTAIGLEAGSRLPEGFVYGEMADGTVIHTWYTDERLTTPWERERATPAAELELYAPLLELYAYEEETFIVNGEEEEGLRLTAYRGNGGAVTLPTEIDGMTVYALGEGFLAECHGVVASLQIGSQMLDIADTALEAPQVHPFGGVVLADEGSYAARWAAEKGYKVNGGVYTLRFETNGGASIAEKTVTAGAYVRLPVPVRSGCEFLGWYLDEGLFTPVELEDDCFVAPGRSLTLYAEWDGEGTRWPFEFEEKNGEMIITAFTGKETQLTIPESIHGLPVTEIGDSAFAGTALASITLPDTVRRVGWRAFAGTNLTSVALPGVEAIAEAAFADCAELREISLPATLTSMGDRAFDGCGALAAITVEEGGVYTGVDGVLFKGQTLVRYPAARDGAEYTLPPTVSSIGMGAFAGAAELTVVTLHDGLAEIGEDAFCDCAGLRAFHMTDAMAVTVIPKGAFSGCSALSSVKLSPGVTAIEKEAFQGCPLLTEIYLPATVEKIDSMAFSSTAPQWMTVQGVYGSAAAVFAKENGFAFVDPDSEMVEMLTILGGNRLALGSITPCEAEITPASAVVGGELRWTSSDESVVYFYGNEAHAVGLGTADITVTAPNGVYAVMTVEVFRPVMVPSADRLILLPGQAAVIDMLPAAEGCLWSSADEAVATVENGRVLALKAGETTITCAANGETVSISLVVADELNTLKLPAAVTAVEAEAFLNSAEVERIILGGQTTTVGARAFAGCAGLAQAEIPAGVTDIEPQAFDGCAQLTLLCVRDSAAHAYAAANGIPYALVGE